MRVLNVCVCVCAYKLEKLYHWHNQDFILGPWFLNCQLMLVDFLLVLYVRAYCAPFDLFHTAENVSDFLIGS